MTARVPPPPDLSNRVVMEYDDVTPKQNRTCVNCGRSFLPLPNDLEPPATYGEAWRPPIICRGTEDETIWSWCCVTGTLYLTGRSEHRFYPDRRRDARPVVVERRSKP